MSWSVSVASVIGGGAAVISAVVARFTWRHRTRGLALPFLGLIVTLATWSLVYGIQLGYGTLAGQLAWQRVTLGVAGFVPTTWLLFVLAYTRGENWLDRNRTLLLLSEPVAFFALCVTNPLHQLVWTSSSLAATSVGPVPVLSFGVGYLVHIVYAYAVVAGGIGLLVVYGTQTAPTYQRQVLLLVTAAVPPFVGHVAFTLGRSPIPALDLTPFLFAFTGLVFGLALFRFELLELAPIARSQSLDEVGDGLVVVNERGEIVDLSGIAPTVLTPTPRVGDPIESVFPDTTLDALDGTELQRSVDGRRRNYQFEVSELTAHRDRTVGTILVLRDITGLRASRQRLSVSNRVLRHNLRNDMNVVLGYADQLESRLDGEDARHAGKIVETAEGLLELAEKARQITTLDGDGGERATIDAVVQLSAVVEELETDHPTAEVRLESSGDAPVEVGDPETFRLALRNVIDNAVRHNDSPDPVVTITVERTEGETAIEVTDDGPGIPEMERRSIESGTETSMEHSQGLGLWLTQWCVTTWGGDLLLEATDAGTTVTITVPKGRAAKPSDRDTAELDG